MMPVDPLRMALLAIVAIVDALAVRPMGMALLTVVAIVAALAVSAAMRLERRALALLGLRLGRRLQTLERLGRGHEIGRQRSDVDLLARGPFDIAQIAPLLVAAEGNRDAVGAGSRGAADAVDILLGHVRQI